MSTIATTSYSQSSAVYAQKQAEYNSSLFQADSRRASSATSASSLASAENIGSQLNSLVSLTRYAMDAMGLGSDSRVTFTQLTNYRSQLEEQFNNAVQKALEDKGIKEVPNFTIQLNDDGTATVHTSSDHGDTLQKLFDENPELVKKYQQIEALSGIDQARQAMQIAPNEMRKRIQIESMANWWAQNNSNTASYFSNYSNGSLSLLQGVNLSV